MTTTYDAIRRLAAAVLLAVAAAGVARAEDIDLYAGVPSAADRPSVLIVLDSSANWTANIPVPDCYYRENGVPTLEGPRAASPDREQGTKMGIEKCALYNVIDALPVGAGGEALVNIGIMLFNESPAANSGAYPRKALLPLTQAAKKEFKDVIRNLHITNDKGNNAAYAKSLYEAFLYLSARAPYRGTAGTKWDSAAVTGGRYVNPANSSCGKSFVIFLANGRPGEVTDGEALELLKAEGGDATQITYPTKFVSNSDQANWADEFARFMANADVGPRDGMQSIVTHTIAVIGSSNDGNYPNFVQGIAAQGGGRFRAASSVDEIVDAILSIFNQILAVNQVFASASLPISVNARGTYLNQIFMGMFRPDAQTLPRWNGNVKQYRFAYDQATDSLEIVDEFGHPAISAATGFIDPGAISYWTRDSQFWANSPSGIPESSSDSPDGAVVEKGATAQRWRELFALSRAARNVYTCLGCSTGTSLGSAGSTRFEVTNAAIGADDLDVGLLERDLLIEWVRGTDNAGDEKGPGGLVTVRPSIHGDVLHSRPAVVSYGERIVVFYGANDGMLHAIEGTRSLPDGGKPLWSFVPEEMFPKLKRLRRNDPTIRFPSTPDAITDAAPRDYFVDGPIGVYQKYSAAGVLEKAHVYVAMRRGERVVYAFDVTDPDAPRFMWKRTSRDLSGLGQTWSEPRVAKIRGHANPVIVMGGGYDPAEDLEPAGTTTMGNSIVVLDAFDGSTVRHFDGLARPVPADVALVDGDFDGYVDRAYAVDLGGHIYRIDFEIGTDASPGAWTLNVLASLGESGGSKFFYAPDVVITKGYSMVLVGSGDREKPLKDVSSDYFYSVIDRNVGKGMDGSFEPIRFSELLDASGFATAESPRGCYLELDKDGEKVVNGAATVGGITYFATHKPTPPDPNSCAGNLGLARNYAMPLFCEPPEVTEINGGGLAPSPVVGVVELETTDPATGEPVTKRVPFIIGGKNAKNSAIEGSKVKLPVTPKRAKRYWFFEGER